ncbi:MAG TPA: hypothetical protein V6D19_14910, partial [Stenomitos sp.]
ASDWYDYTLAITLHISVIPPVEKDIQAVDVSKSSLAGLWFSLFQWYCPIAANAKIQIGIRKPISRIVEFQAPN